MTDNRTYTTKRSSIVSAIKREIEKVNGSGNWASRIAKVYDKLVYFTDMPDLPSVCIIAGQETRDYQGGGYKDRYLTIKILIFVEEMENALVTCDKILEDIETLIENNARLTYYDKLGSEHKTIDMGILSISTDEGALDPISVGEMIINVHY